MGKRKMFNFWFLRDHVGLNRPNVQYFITSIKNSVGSNASKSKNGLVTFVLIIADKRSLIPAFFLGYNLTSRDFMAVHE